jgi:hypothetical protein
MTGKAIRGPLYSPITYDPMQDARVCILYKGDIQCNFITRNGDGFLHCCFKLNHVGRHHTCYVDTEGHQEQLVWFECDR